MLNIFASPDVLQLHCIKFEPRAPKFKPLDFSTPNIVKNKTKSENLDEWLPLWYYLRILNLTNTGYVTCMRWLV